jgi:hypothetical protein
MHAGQTVETINHWVSRYWNTLPTAQISPLPTIISSDRSKMLYGQKSPEVVHKWLRDQLKTFYVEGIRKLVDHWTKCIEKEGAYVEK